MEFEDLKTVEKAYKVEVVYQTKTIAYLFENEVKAKEFVKESVTEKTKLISSVLFNREGAKERKKLDKVNVLLPLSGAIYVSNPIETDLYSTNIDGVFSRTKPEFYEEKVEVEKLENVVEQFKSEENTDRKAV